MFHALTHHPVLTQAQHSALPHVSNTDLSQLKATLLGKPNTPNPVALAYGSHYGHTQPHRTGTQKVQYSASASRPANSSYAKCRHALGHSPATGASRLSPLSNPH